MSYDKILLSLTLLILMIIAIYAQIKFMKVIKEENYKLYKIKVLNITTQLDIKKGTSYEVTYDILGTPKTVVTQNKPKMNPITKKSNIYISQDNSDKIKPKKNYLTIIIGCAFLICAQIFIAFM